MDGRLSKVLALWIHSYTAEASGSNSVCPQRTLRQTQRETERERESTPAPKREGNLGAAFLSSACVGVTAAVLRGTDVLPATGTRRNGAFCGI